MARRAAPGNTPAANNGATLGFAAKLWQAADKLRNNKVGTLSPQSRIPPSELIQRLSYSHLGSIVDLDGDDKALRC